MITLKEHIELSKHMESDEKLKEYFTTLDAVTRLKMYSAIEHTYPLKQSDSISDYIKENFTLYDNVFGLVLGQFIMIEQILTGKFKFDNPTDMDIELATYLLRPLGEKEFDNTDKDLEVKNREAIINTPVQDIYNVLNRFLKNREIVLFKQFAGVFYEVEEDEDEDEISTPIDASFNQQWYWYSIVRSLAQEDIRRYEEIYMLRMNVVLPEMSYIAQRNKVEGAKQRASAAINRL